MAFNIESFKAMWSIPGKGKGKEPIAYNTLCRLVQLIRLRSLTKPITADGYLDYVINYYKNRLVYEGDLSDKKWEPVVETYTTLRKDI